MTDNTENKESRHVDCKMRLLNGRVLDCYPAEEKIENVDNELSLDTTGVYLSLKKPSGKTKSNDFVAKQKTLEEEEQEELKKLFIENAFLFLENRERILSDSRMFLCPVPIQSGLAYSGTSGFHRPTLGIYLEWWQRCEQASFLDSDGGKWLVYLISGSPLSGSNCCGIVNPQGETGGQYIPLFKKLWPSFIHINCRYDEAKHLYQAYSLRQVIAILQAEGLHVKGFVPAKHINYLEQVNSGLRTEVSRLRKQLQQTYSALKFEKMKSKESELRAFVVQYRQRKELVDKQVAEIREQRIGLRKRLKSDEIDNIIYQRLWTPIRRKRNKIEFDLRHFEEESLRKLIPDMPFSYQEVDNFLNQIDSESGKQDGQCPSR